MNSEPTLPPANNCFYCDEQLEKAPGGRGGKGIGPNHRTIDHVIPKSNGGLNRQANRVWACRWCNTSKGNKTIENWVRWLQRAEVSQWKETARRKRRKVIGRWMDGKIVAPVTNPH